MGAWKNKTMIFSIRRAEDTDYFGINTDLKNTFIEIDGIKYVVSLAVKLEGLKDGEDTFTGIIDLALLADPNSLSNAEK
jgi:predicted aspartyl protease